MERKLQRISMNKLHMVTFILLVVGGLNWGLMGVADYNFVETLLGAGSTLTTIVYVLVGLAAVVEVVSHKKNCKNCVSSGQSM